MTHEQIDLGIDIFIVVLLIVLVLKGFGVV
jgi:hypothetical protein